MSVLYLLDTNVISEPVQPKPNIEVVNKITTHMAELALSSITIHELVFGMQRMPDGKRKSRLEEYINDAIQGHIPILSYDENAAIWHAQERARQQKAGTPTPMVDGQIASIAAVNNLTLVTRNVKDFQYFDSLKIENWYDS